MTVSPGADTNAHRIDGDDQHDAYLAVKPWVLKHGLPSGELTFCYGNSPFFMGKSTISMAIFNCYVSSPEGNHTAYQLILN